MTFQIASRLSTLVAVAVLGYLSASTAVLGSPVVRLQARQEGEAPLANFDPATLLASGKAAQALNLQYQSLTASSSCTEGQLACVSGQFATCTGGSYQLSACGSSPPDVTCLAIPDLVDASASTGCNSASFVTAEIAFTGATGGLTGQN